MTTEQLTKERERLIGLREQAVQQVLRLEGAIAMCNDLLAAQTAVPENRAARRRAKKG